MKNQFYLLFFSIFLFTNCNPKSVATKNNKTFTDFDFVITNVSILPMTSDEVLKDQNVFVKDGKILAINSSNAFKAKNKVDGTGKFLMPGLTEMHAHIPIAKKGNDSLVVETLFLYLSQGVTTIRGMLGDPYHLGLRTQAAEGKILSPRIYTSSPSMNGNSTPTPKVAIDKVTRYKKEGYDFLKIHPGITLETWDALEKTAKKVGIGFSGHVPTAVGIHRALEAQYKTVDHLDGYLEGLVPASENVDPNANGFFGYEFTNLADMKLMEGLVDKTFKNGVAVVATQTLFTRWFSPKPARELLQQNEMKYISPKTRFAWRQSQAALSGSGSFDEVQWKKFVNIRKQLMKRMDEKGVTFLLGSDAPQVYNVPGFSIHREMKDMKDAGLSNYKILQSGTINPAEFFDAKGKYGTIEKGAAADLILVNGNPLEDLSNAQKIEGVMVKGKWLSREFIDGKLKEIEEKYRE